MHTKEELEREKLRHEVNNLKYGWIQRFTAVAGIGIILITTIVTNVNEYLKVKRLENKEKQVAAEVRSDEKQLKREVDSLKEFDLSPLSKEIRFSEDYSTHKQTPPDNGKNPEQAALFYRTELDSLTGMIIRTKAIKEALLGIVTHNAKTDTTKGNHPVN